MERLTQKKEQLTSTTIYNRENSADFNKQKGRKGGIENSSLVISTSGLGDNEIAIQISTLKNNKGSIGEVISILEDEGLDPLNATSFETFEDRIFYTLHFQVLLNILSICCCIYFVSCYFTIIIFVPSVPKECHILIFSNNLILKCSFNLLNEMISSRANIYDSF